jgi:putative ABC transport system permease protein
MELGLLGGVGRTATMLFDKLNFDLIITSAEYLDMSRAGKFPRARLAQSQAASSVTDAIPVTVGFGGWRVPSRTGLFGTTPGGAVTSISL